MFGMIDTNGDLGRGEKLITVAEFPLLTLKAAHFLRAVGLVCQQQRFEEDKILKYAIELYKGQIDETLLERVSLLIPRGVDWYTMDGRRLFDVRGAGGGIVSSQICYLICNPRGL